MTKPPLDANDPPHVWWNFKTSTNSTKADGRRATSQSGHPRILFFKFTGPSHYGIIFANSSKAKYRMTRCKCRLSKRLGAIARGPPQGRGDILQDLLIKAHRYLYSPPYYWVAFLRPSFVSSIWRIKYWTTELVKSASSKQWISSLSGLQNPHLI